MTNYEKIKNMTIDEMAEFFDRKEWCKGQCNENGFLTCIRCKEEYLESEVEE